MTGLPAAADRALTRAARAHHGGRIDEAVRLYREAIRIAPGHAPAHYDLGLVHKYAGRWRSSLRANLRALALGLDDPAPRWNAGIAATALADWKTARAMWKAAGVALPAGRGDPQGDFGLAVVRLDPGGRGETVWARRICPARAVLLNVPLPESGFRFRDVVLNDGAPQGWRGEGKSRVPVFNVLARLAPSRDRTYGVEVHAPDAGHVEALKAIARAAGTYAEDWSASVVSLCLRCSYGVPHRHPRRKAAAPKAWQPVRTLGIAARRRDEAEALLARWVRADPARAVRALYATRRAAAAGPRRRSWWSYEESGE